MSESLIEAFETIRIEQGFSNQSKAFAQHCAPLVEMIDQSKKPIILGMSGPQGSGKTSLAQTLARLFKSARGLHVLVLSLDDFYLTLAERTQLGKDVHPLLATRGVPGTHDMALLSKTLRASLSDTKLKLPRFDKSKDDRAGLTEVKGPFDLVIFEGWCLGAQAEHVISPAINSLEETEDQHGIWRHWVEDHLELYQELFRQVDLWAYMSAPDWPRVSAWREAQEMDLQRMGRAAPMLEPGKLKRFMMFYQRLTLRAFEQMPQKADWYAQLDANQQIIRVQTKSKGKAKAKATTKAD